MPLENFRAGNLFLKVNTQNTLTQVSLKEPSSVCAGKEDILTMEYHNQALDIWRERGLKNKVLIHIDGHIDFFWVGDEDPLSLLGSDTLNELCLSLKNKPFWNLFKKNSAELVDIGNYLYPAIKEGIVREFYWVVPDPIWDNKKQRDIFKKIFLKIKSFNPQAVGQVRVFKDRIETSILGVKTVVLKLSHLPVIKEEVLLDIDIDFMLTESLKGRAPYFSRGKTLPWIWPEELVSLFKAKKINRGTVTLTYSVEGGFTPLEYKYLGYELKILLKDGHLGESCLNLRRATEFYNHGNISESLNQLKKGILSSDATHQAALHYRIFKILKEQGKLEEATTHLKEAIRIDGTYNTVYNNQALRLKQAKKFGHAIEESRFFLELFPEETAYRLVLADSLLESGRIDEALKEYLHILKTNPHHTITLISAGSIYFKKRNFEIAKEFLNRALSIDDKDRLGNFWLGMVYSRTQELNNAIRYLQKSTLLGKQNPGVYFRLALLYAKTRNFYKAREKLAAAFRAAMHNKYS
ncbi:MAG: tetratricopeptide repeat protein [Candidatus Omnitrophota bacterium]